MVSDDKSSILSLVLQMTCAEHFADYAFSYLYHVIISTNQIKLPGYVIISTNQIKLHGWMLKSCDRALSAILSLVSWLENSVK
jgi:hypothetical protein